MGLAMSDRIAMAQDFQISMDLLDLLCGNFVGEGNSRIVFDCPLKPGWVTKIVKNADCHDNILEHELWVSVCNAPELAKWLAPAGWLSANGRVMLQRKVARVTDSNKKKIPEKIPAFLTDVKFDNFGFIGNQFVSVDYAFSVSICANALKTKMKPFKSHLGEK